MNPCTCERLLHEAGCLYDGPPITAGQDHDPRPPVTRPPVELSPCRGCSAPYERWDLRPDGVFCLACGIDDPNGIGRPRPATAEELALAATRVRLRAAGEGA